MLEKLPDMIGEISSENDQMLMLIFEKSQKLSIEVLLKNVGELTISMIKLNLALEFTHPPFNDSN